MENNNLNESLESLKKLVGDNNIRPIDENDSFGFKCKQCGQCCMHRNDIILNPFDVYNASKYLNIAPEEFITKYTFPSLGSGSKIPMVLLKSEKNGFCPFLKLDIKGGGKFKCTIHDAKPGACANHPIGVARGKNKETGEESIHYIICQQCNNSVSNEMQVVKDWVKKYKDNEKEIALAHEIQTMVTEYFDTREFFEMNCNLYTITKDLANDGNHTPEEVEKLLGTVEEIHKGYIVNTLSIGYAEYDINKPFIPQAVENIKELREFYEHIKTIFEKTKDFFEKYQEIKLEEGEDEDVNE